MSDDTPSNIFLTKLAELEKARAETKPPAEPEWSVDIPDIEYTVSPEDTELDRAIKNMDVVDAYNRWCKKMRPDTRGGRKKEGIKVSCPNPAHPDKHPSAWLNSAKGVYYCSGCALGGDVWDMAAWHYGYSVPGYKYDATLFRELREKIGNELGFVKSIGGQLVGPTPPEALIPPQRVPEDLPSNVRVLPSAVVQQQAEEAAEQKQINTPTIDWRALVPQNTFLRTWLEATTIDTCPEEYHFWTGLMAIGFAVGRNRLLQDTRPAVPNLFVCFVGPSGAGKSSAKSYLREVVQTSMPYDFENPLSSGTKYISSPGSAEYIVQSLSAPIPDPIVPKKLLGYAPVRAQIDFEELASLIGISARVGSTMKPQLIEIYDAAKEIGSGSLTHGGRRAFLPFGQVTSSTQDGSLRALVSKGDEVSGFLNRWVFASGRLKRPVSLGGVTVNIHDSAEELKKIHRWADTSKDITLTDAAAKLWDEFFHDVLVPTKDASEKKGSVLLNRIDLLYKKLIVLFASNLMQLEAGTDVVQQALDLHPYLLRTYGIVNEEMGGSPELDLEDKVMDTIRKFIKANNKYPSVRDLHQSLRKQAGTAKLRDVCKNLEIMGRIEPLSSPEKQAGRPTTRYRIIGE